METVIIVIVIITLMLMIFIDIVSIRSSNETKLIWLHVSTIYRLIVNPQKMTGSLLARQLNYW